MVDVHVPAVIAATIGAFMLSAAYYAALGNQLATVNAAAAAAAGDQPAPWAIAAELARTAVIVAVVAGLASRTGADDWAGGAVLGLALWAGFVLTQWLGAMLHERTPLRLAAIHAGDWLVKLVLVGVIIGAWR